MLCTSFAILIYDRDIIIYFLLTVSAPRNPRRRNQQKVREATIIISRIIMAETTTGPTDDGKKRKRSQDGERDTKSDQGGGSKKKIKAYKPAVFVGQLSFKTTAEGLRGLFEQRGVPGVKVRLLTDRKTKRSRGMAFVELLDEFAVTKALRIHHQMLDGRQINVERTVGGGGSKSERRKEKLSKLREIQGETIKREVSDMIADLISKAREEDKEVKADLYESLDERNKDALCTFPIKIVGEILKDLGDTLKHKAEQSDETTEVKNYNKYLMGML